ncbi:MAG: diacylglycerol/lipid kinase family protein [Nostocoides sp.]
MTRFALVASPTAGAGRATKAAELARSVLEAQSHEVVDVHASTAEDAVTRARAVVNGGTVDALVVVGGDGMVHVGINAIAETNVPLGIVAAGTGNDLARSLGLPVGDPTSSIETLLAGRIRTIDAVQTRANASTRWFVGVLAAGFDAAVNERANAWTWPRGQWRYTMATLRELPVFRPIPYVLTIDGVRRELSAMLVAVGNAPAYGGGMRVLPQAQLDDGVMDVIILHEASVATLLRVLPLVFSGRHVGHPKIEIVTAREVTVDAPSVMAYADGERFAQLPVELCLVPGAVRVFA